MAPTEDVRFALIDAGARVGLLTAQHSSVAWKWHHEQYTFGFLHDGGYEILARGESLGLTSGQVLLSEPGDVSICRQVHKPVCCDVLSLDPEFIRAAAADGRERARIPHIGNPISRSPVLVAALRRFLAEASQAAPSLALDEALTSIVDAFLTTCGPTARRAGYEPRAVREVRSILHERLSDVVRLDDLATAVGLNKSYLVRSFTKAIGIPPRAYQRTVRLSRARRLLAAGEPASRVAQQLGFADQSHFIRIFRQSTGLTPAKYARAKPGR